MVRASLSEETLPQKLRWEQLKKTHQVNLWPLHAHVYACTHKKRQRKWCFNVQPLGFYFPTLIFLPWDLMILEWTCLIILPIISIHFNIQNSSTYTYTYIIHTHINIYTHVIYLLWENSMFTITQRSPGDMLWNFCACLVPSEAEGYTTREYLEGLMVCLISTNSCGSHADKSLWIILFEK